MTHQITSASAFLAAVGENLRVHRETAGLSQAALAGKAGVSAKLISRLEGGGANPAVLTLEKIAASLGTSVSELVDVEGSELGLGYRRLD